MSTKEELFASRFDEDLDKLEVDAAIELGADSLTYLSVEGLDSAFAGDRCAACFDGVYPRPISGTRRDQIIADRESR
jgi:glutamine phosphoribosylpyrophosphate amidotransferase